MSTATNCKEFRAHHLRPDKCRNCFSDQSSHSSTTGASGSKGTSSGNMESGEERAATMTPTSEIKDKQQVEANRVKCSDCQLKDKEIEKLKRELKSAQVERDLAREEHQALEREMEEMHDNFKEDESEQFEQIKQELDVALKNCKILQIRLNKCERQYGQLEQTKLSLEKQVEELQASQPSCLKSTTITNQTSSQNPFIQLNQEFVKLSSREYDQLLRDLNDTSERERDLQEQIKYSQEEAQLKSDRLQAIEAENEVLLSKVNKLTLANSRLRSGPISRNSSLEKQSSASQNETITSGRTSAITSDTSQEADNKQSEQQVATSSVSLSLVNSSLSGAELIQQNEQLKLALELAQSECERLRGKVVDLGGQLDSRESLLKELEGQKSKLETELSRSSRNTADQSNNSNATHSSSEIAKLELECRQLRARLVHSERDCKQLRSQLEMFPGSGSLSGSTSGGGGGGGGKESTSSPGVALKNLQDEVATLRAQKVELERRVRQLSGSTKISNSSANWTSEASVTESDLLEKLKRQLDVSESELAKAKSRLVEMDLECGRANRQYRRLVSSLESSGSSFDRKSKLPPEASREAMSRQELKQLIRELELELEECVSAVKAKDCLLKEYMSTVRGAIVSTSGAGGDSPPATQAAGSPQAEEQLKSLRRLVDQERLLSNNLKLDVANLEQTKYESETRTRMLERERVAMEEELDKLRQVNLELNGSLEEQKKLLRSSLIKLKEVQSNYERVCNQMQAKGDQSASETTSTTPTTTATSRSNSSDTSSSGDLLLMARNLSELKVKNGFLMRQLEIAREDTTRQLDELRESCEIQQRRAVELAQLELKERHLAEVQSIKDELSEHKQKLSANQRALTRAEEEVALERDRLRSIERDFRRDKSHWQQRLEQLEAQQTIERRSNEFRVKEIESVVREKERELLSFQDRYVQMERDFKRLQNKYNQLEEDQESKVKSLTRDLDAKKREFNDLLDNHRARESEYYENCNRFNAEKATLLEALESIKRSFNEKLAELKSTRELMLLRQDQSYKERQQSQDRIENLSQQLIIASEFESQNKLLRHQLASLEKQFESTKRDYLQLKEERLKLKTRIGELEQRVHEYEKLELKSKTTSLTGSSSGGGSTGGLFSRSPFRSSSSKKSEAVKSAAIESSAPTESDDNSDKSTIEKLTSKIQDQRQLINLLRQQLAETQMELKHLKLLQAAEKNKWQSRVTLLTGRLNEAEEKLVFETSLIQPANQETFEGARRKLEVKWAEERRTTLEMLQQAQAQNEMMTRDLKKISQSYDLLRLQSKQLESNNQKLSKKLIEYQQPQIGALGQVTGGGGGSHNLRGVSKSQAHELETCQREKAQLLRQRQQLERANASLMEVMKSEAAPLVEIVNKILQSLDEPLPASKADGAATPSSGFQSSQSSTPSQEWQSSRSTMRPLRTASTFRRQSAGGGGDEAEFSDESGALDSTSLSISTAKPAHQTVDSTGGQSRLSRLLSGNKSSSANTKTNEPSSGGPSTLGAPKSTKLVKRVRVKCASLGITATEKKRLRSHLQELNSTLSNLSEFRLLSASSASGSTGGARHAPGSCLKSSSTTNQHSNDESESVASRVHWQLDSDLDSLDNQTTSNKQQPSSRPQSTTGLYTTNGNWSQGRSSSEQPSDTRETGRRFSSTGSNSSLATGTGGANLYRRFPQSTPSSYGASGAGGGSLTDYESESSLASDFIMTTGYLGIRDRLPSGAESDSCVAAATSGQKVRKRGLKSRLTNTLRNISRSITGLASDSEETIGENQRRSSALQSGKSGARSQTVEPEDLTSGRSLREIRV